MDKKRFGRRGPKKRHSVFKAEGNEFWSTVYERLVRKICEHNNLNVENEMVADKAWRETFDKLRHLPRPISIQMAQHSVHEEYVDYDTMLKLKCPRCEGTDLLQSDAGHACLDCEITW